MSLQFKARVLLELGAELISSDAVAIYELVKNGIDAGSAKVEIRLHIALQPSAMRELQAFCKNIKTWDINAFIGEVSDRLESSASADDRTRFLAGLTKSTDGASGFGAIRKMAFEMNRLTVVDFGCGMTLKALRKHYLTVGTPMRLHQRTESHSPLGEKGIGRLAAMRLGHHVHVETGVKGSRRWSQLEMDWRPAFLDADLDASALIFSARASAKKAPEDAGTRITIRALQSDWQEEKIKELSTTDFAKLADPFDGNYASRFIKIFFQGQPQNHILGFRKPLLKDADAVCNIEYHSDPDPETRFLKVTTEYRRYDKRSVSTHTGAHLNDVVSHSPRRVGRRSASHRLPNSDEVIASLSSLGDFTARFHWFNRGRLRRDDSERWKTTLEPFTRDWSGGLLVYRDGFRVYPYGAQSDDWLDLDRKALASSAFKLNRAQIVGYLRISAKGNPKLQDQTNREGIRDCPEKEALRRMLRQAIISDCKVYLEKVDKEHREEDDAADEATVEDIDISIKTSQHLAVTGLRSLRDRVPEESDAIEAVLCRLADVEEAWERAKGTIKGYGEREEQYMHLASVGLMVEVIAHELARASGVALEILDQQSKLTDSGFVENLKAQLETLSKRVRVLDEVSIPGRQKKSIVDIHHLVLLINEVYEGKAARHGVQVSITKTGGTFNRRVQKGQILQILDNLMSNSMYWLARRLNRDHPPKISIELDATTGTLSFSDNGPGIHPDVGDQVFDAFKTSKEANGGRGLGLYIARNFAKDNGAQLELIRTTAGRHPGFKLTFSQNAAKGKE